MIRTVLILACALILASCESDLNTNSSTPIPHTKKISMDLGPHTYDFDSLRAGQYMFVANGGTDSMSVYLRRGSSDVFGEIDFTLYLRWQKPESGSYKWEDLSVNEDGYGCIITIDSINSDYRRTYRSVSGSTHVEVFKSSVLDSIFGVFNGLVKDSLGNIVEIKNGRFYFDD